MRRPDDRLPGSTLVAKRPVVCDHNQRRKMRTAARGSLAGCYYPGVHANCMHNEASALLMRSLAPPPAREREGLGDRFLEAFTKLQGICSRFRGSRWSHLETAYSYTGALRRRYIEAERSLRMDGPLVRKDWYLTAFLKAEKVKAEKVTKPRMIFPRSPRYNLELATWLKPFEHWLWGNLTADKFFGGSKTRVCAKGLSPRERANLIVRKFRQFKDCVCFEVDGAAFEAHISREQLIQEHKCYLRAFRGSKGLRKVLGHQLTLEGVTAGGWKFRRDGGRASGDYNTGMGNTLIMLAAVYSALQGRGFPWDVLADGDNAIIFVESCNYHAAQEGFYQRVLDECGHEMVLERPAVSIEQIRFGQSAPVLLSHRVGWTMVREPVKVLSGVLSSHRWMTEPVGGRRWAAGVGRCELSLARGLPMLQSMALDILEQTEGSKPLRPEAYRDYIVMGAKLDVDKSYAIEPTPECRASFYDAFGYDCEAQRRFEGERFAVEFPRVWEPEQFHTLNSLWNAPPGILEDLVDVRI